MRYVMTIGALLLMVTLTGCQPLEQSARDGIATFDGALAAAHDHHAAECTANNQLAACQTINKGIAAKRTAITALEAYCGFSPGTPLDAPCAPVTSAGPALQAALNNLNQLLTDVKGLSR